MDIKVKKRSELTDGELLWEKLPIADQRLEFGRIRKKQKEGAKKEHENQKKKEEELMVRALVDRMAK